MANQQKRISLKLPLFSYLKIDSFEWITMPYEDKSGRLITAVRLNNIYGILIEHADNEPAWFLNADCVKNPINTGEHGNVLLRRLHQIGDIPRFHLLYSETGGKREVIIIPPMMAAGKNSYLEGMDVQIIKSSYLKKCGHDAEEIKKEALHKKADISLFDCYVNKADNQIVVMRKGATGEPQFTGVYLTASAHEISLQYKLIASAPTIIQAERQGLVDDYNSANPENPIIPNGTAKGEIGGVGMQTGIFMPILEDPLAHFYKDWVIGFPQLHKERPFPDALINQVIIEVSEAAIEGQAPWISIDFLSSEEMETVLPPQFRQGIIGRAFMVLDYLLKCLANGGYFEESQLMGYDPKNPPKPKLVKDEMARECPDIPYYTVRDLLVAHGMDHTVLYNSKGQQLLQSSFRLIASIDRIDRQHNVLIPHMKYEVQYTLKPTAALRNIESINLEKINSIYAAVAANIQEILPRWSLARQYLSVLGLATTTFYLSSTLKRLGQQLEVPLTRMDSALPVPVRIPHLPIKDENFSLRTQSILEAKKAQEERKKEVE